MVGDEVHISLLKALSMLGLGRERVIRVPVDGISFRSRSAGGVRVFNTGADETVVSVARIAENGEDEAEEA